MQHLGKHKGMRRMSLNFLQKLKSFLVIYWLVQPIGQLQLPVDNFSSMASLFFWHNFCKVTYMRGAESNNMKGNLEICLHHSTFPAAGWEGSRFSTFSPLRVSVTSLMATILVSGKWFLTAVVHVPADEGCWASVLVLTVICVSSLECLSDPLPIFKWGCLYFIIEL